MKKILKFLSISGFVLVGIIFIVAVIRSGDSGNLINASYECEKYLRGAIKSKSLEIENPIKFKGTKEISSNHYQITSKYKYLGKVNSFGCNVWFKEGQYSVELIR